MLQQKLSKWQKQSGKQAEEHVCKLEVQDELKQIRVMYFKKPDVVKKYWENDYVKDQLEQETKEIKRGNPD